MKIKEIHIRLIGIPILATIMSFVFGTEPGEAYVEKWFTSLLYTGLFWNGAAHLFFFYRKKFPLIGLTPKRLSLTTISLVAFLVAGDFLICQLIEANEVYTLAHSIPSLIAGIIIGLAYEAVYFFDQWKHTVKVNEALKNQQIRAQFEVLQNQMSPHFLFNSLNTLTTLIAEDVEVAIKFTEKLSEVYRYILQNKERDLVKLADELDFAKSYFFLLKIRYPKNLTADFMVPEKYLNSHVAPLTLQMLIENSVKHNEISSAHPLHIDVFTENMEHIVVKNLIKKKNSLDRSTQTGLANIRKRYAYLSEKEIMIEEDEYFKVSIPLISVVHRTNGILEAV